MYHVLIDARKKIDNSTSIFTNWISSVDSPQCNITSSNNDPESIEDDIRLVKLFLATGGGGGKHQKNHHRPSAPPPIWTPRGHRGNPCFCGYPARDTLAESKKKPFRKDTDISPNSQTAWPNVLRGAFFRGRGGPETLSTWGAGIPVAGRTRALETLLRGWSCEIHAQQRVSFQATMLE